MPQLRLLPVAALLTCLLTSFSAASVTIDQGYIYARAFRQLDGMDQEVNLPGTADGTALATINDSFFSLASRAIDGDGISIGLDQLRGGGYGDTTFGYAYAFFTPDVSTPYSISGSFTKSAGYGSFYGNLLDISAGQWVFSQETLSHDALNVQFGDNNGITTAIGSLTGLLQAGHQYIFEMGGISQAYPNADEGGSASGTARLQFGDVPTEVVPEPASLAVWSSLGLSCVGMTALRRRRRSANVVA